MTGRADFLDAIWRRKLASGRGPGPATPRGRIAVAAETLPAEGERILDLACGDGALAVALGGRFREVHGVDVSPTAAKAAEANGVKVRIVDLDREPLSYPDATFDAACCLDSITYFLDPEGVLREVRRVLRPGGVFFVTFPNLRNWRHIASLLGGRFPVTSLDPEGRDGGQLHHFTLGDFRALAERAGFAVDSARPVPPTRGLTEFRASTWGVLLRA